MTQPAHSKPVTEIVYDDSRWPFVLVTMPPGALTDEQLANHLRDIDAYTRRDGRFGFVVDARVGDPPNAAQRRLIAEAMDTNGKRDAARFIGVAIVLNSAPKRAVFKALLWLRQEKLRLKAVATIDEGLKWLRELQRVASATRRA